MLFALLISPDGSQMVGVELLLCTIDAAAVDMLNLDAPRAMNYALAIQQDAYMGDIRIAFAVVRLGILAIGVVVVKEDEVTRLCLF